jgi:hypothetical protein
MVLDTGTEGQSRPEEAMGTATKSADHDATAGRGILLVPEAVVGGVDDDDNEVGGSAEFSACTIVIGWH